MKSKNGGVIFYKSILERERQFMTDETKRNKAVEWLERRIGDGEPPKDYRNEDRSQSGLPGWLMDFAVSR